MSFDLSEHSHRRFNPLTGEWAQVSPHRSKRPWQGQLEKHDQPDSLQHDPNCYLCAGNKRSNGETNPDYKSTFSFVNDFSALSADIPEGMINEKDLLVARSERGICKVICFSPRHDLTIAGMQQDDIANIVRTWINEYTELSKIDWINSIQIFENKGEVMGCSNPHPHGQIWAQESIPVELFKKHYHQQNYYQKHGSLLLHDYLNLELEKKERIVLENDHFVVLVPFWAVWPFETMIIPRRNMSRITEMNEAEISAFADIYRQITIRYDKLFNTSFPYSAGIHQAPSNGENYNEWQWHFVFYPPLLRSASIKKFMVGYEMLANPQRDITPEWSANRLRELS